MLLARLYIHFLSPHDVPPSTSTSRACSPIDNQFIVKPFHRLSQDTDYGVMPKENFSSPLGIMVSASAKTRNSDCIRQTGRFSSMIVTSTVCFTALKARNDSSRRLFEMLRKNRVAFGLAWGQRFGPQGHSTEYAHPPPSGDDSNRHDVYSPNSAQSETGAKVATMRNPASQRRKEREKSLMR